MGTMYALGFRTLSGRAFASYTTISERAFAISTPIGVPLAITATVQVAFVSYTSIILVAIASQKQGYRHSAAPET